MLSGILGVDAKQIKTLENVDIINKYDNASSGTALRHPPITADIMGRTLTISINHNVGIAQIIIRDSNGAIVELDNIMSSPETTCIYIDDSGCYRIDIILNNGDQYYGYFTVHDGIIL